MRTLGCLVQGPEIEAEVESVRPVPASMDLEKRKSVPLVWGMIAESWMLYVVYVQPSPVHERGRGYAGGLVGVVEYVVVGRGDANARDEKNRVVRKDLIPDILVTEECDITATERDSSQEVKTRTEV